MQMPERIEAPASGRTLAQGQFPRTLAEFRVLFPDEEACRDCLARIRWAGGFACPRCGGRSAWRRNRGLLVCTACRYEASPTAGTVFQDTHMTLRLWFTAIWWISRHAHGATALGLQRVLGLRSYRTAWSWFHKLRRALFGQNGGRLSGRVEVAVGRLGGRRETAPRAGHALARDVFVAAQADGPGAGMISVRRAGGNARGLAGFIRDAVEASGIVDLGAWEGPAGEADAECVRSCALATHGTGRSRGFLPRVDRIVFDLKRWLMGVYRGAVGPEHLACYLDEFVFRFNHPLPLSEGGLFRSLLEKAVRAKPVPYRTIVMHEGG